MKRLWNYLFSYEKRAVDEIMRPLTRIHDALHARSENAKIDGINAHQRALNLLDEAGQHREVAAAADAAKAKLASLLS